MESSTNMTFNQTEIKNLYKAPNATLYFSHSTAILPFLSLLGLNQDEYILGHNNYEQASDRYVELFFKPIF